MDVFASIAQQVTAARMQAAVPCEPEIGRSRADGRHYTLEVRRLHLKERGRKHALHLARYEDGILDPEPRPVSGALFVSRRGCDAVLQRDRGLAHPRLWRARGGRGSGGRRARVAVYPCHAAFFGEQPPGWCGGGAWPSFHLSSVLPPSFASTPPPSPVCPLLFSFTSIHIKVAFWEQLDRDGTDRIMCDLVCRGPALEECERVCQQLELLSRVVMREIACEAHVLLSKLYGRIRRVQQKSAAR